MKIAFYAPIKPPDHPIPSGDRLIARNLISALKWAGHDIELASSFVAYSKRADGSILKEKKADALAEAERLVEALSPRRPDCWMTYHPYCKAPDWIGPIVCDHLKIPYITVEAARTGQGFESGGDLWRDWRLEAQAGIAKADLHLCFKPTDRNYLHSFLPETVPTAMIPPFVDTQDTETSHASSDINLDPALPDHWRPDWPVLLTVGMMRPGKKVENYRIIAEALTGLQALQWNLIAIGGGPQEEEIRSFFNQITPKRLLFTGGVEHKQVLSLMNRSDIFVWPGWKEPIGMVYLEAQLSGLPVCALDSMGVPLTVKHGKTGLLSPENEPDRFRQNLAELISHPDLRNDLATAAPIHVRNNHSLSAASASMQTALRQHLDIG